MTDQEFILWASKAVQSFDPQTHNRVQIKEPPRADLGEDYAHERTAHFKVKQFNSRQGLYVWKLDYIELSFLSIQSAGEGAKQ